uniref:CARD domain-containing protein n=1 Tax=Anopheles farauti TaxID=69004 RepID=A0A182Q022_9DIPT
MADETGEVRSLLMRHRLSIVRDLIGTSLVQVLLKAGVLTVSQEEQLTGEPSLDARCDQLIELIARDGFEKFKQFCYAIESECSQLISDLINDKLSQVDDDCDTSLGYDAANLTAIPSSITAVAASGEASEECSLTTEANIPTNTRTFRFGILLIPRLIGTIKTPTSNRKCQPGGDGLEVTN